MSDPVELTIDHLGAQGDGVASTSAGQVFVSYTLPGERITGEKAGDGRVRLLEVLQPSPNRIAPVCQHFTTCGGCAVQHLKRAAYLDWKREQARVAFTQRGIDPAVASVESTAGHRRRAVFSARRTRSGAVLGFHEARSDEIAEIAECPVLVPAIVERLPQLRRLAAPLLSRSGEARITVLAACNGLDVAIDGVPDITIAEQRAAVAHEAASIGLVRLCVGGDVIFASAEPVVRFAGVNVVPPPGVFLQAVGEAEVRMTDLIMAAIPKAKRVADLFCGVGTFTFPLARKARVLAVDGDKRAIAALAEAAKHAQGLKPVETKVRDLFREPLSRKELEGFDAVIFDPPRAGANAQAARIAQSKAETVVAVSCNPATLARDARTLIDGGYHLQSVTPIDQFQYSPHVEAIAVFRR